MCQSSSVIENYLFHVAFVSHEYVLTLFERILEFTVLIRIHVDLLPQMNFHHLQILQLFSHLGQFGDDHFLLSKKKKKKVQVVKKQALIKSRIKVE